MTTGQKIKTLVTIIEIYRKINQAITEALKLDLSVKKDYRALQKRHNYLTQANVRLRKSTTLYKKVVGTRGHEAHLDAVIEIRTLAKNPTLSQPDVRIRLNNDAVKIRLTTLELKQELEDLVKEL